MKNSKSIHVLELISGTGLSKSSSFKKILEIPHFLLRIETPLKKIPIEGMLLITELHRQMWEEVLFKKHPSLVGMKNEAKRMRARMEKNKLSSQKRRKEWEAWAQEKIKLLGAVLNLVPCKKKLISRYHFFGFPGN